MKDPLDLYQVLGVGPRATPEQLARAYRALVRRHHPDSREQSGTGAEHDRALGEVMDAYATLRDEQRRAAYDRRRAEEARLRAEEARLRAGQERRLAEQARRAAQLREAEKRRRTEQERRAAARQGGRRPAWDDGWSEPVVTLGGSGRRGGSRMSIWVSPVQRDPRPPMPTLDELLLELLRGRWW
ncbi:DnaJ domain-containing protein [Georgenia sp. AZ-5]|uniref:J domain-containing protein n=1 Tax=Georgenia sp. AZ-5 TaxID=3367526 RepID=UPI00375496D4